MSEPRDRIGDAGEPGDDALSSAICAAVIGVVLTAGALASHGRRAALSVAVGALIGVANLLTMRAIVRALLPPPPPSPAAPTEDEAGAPSPPPAPPSEGRRGGAAWGVFAVLKMFLLFGGILVLLAKGLVDPIPLCVGYGVLPLGIVASTVLAARRARRG